MIKNGQKSKKVGYFEHGRKVFVGLSPVGKRELPTGQAGGSHKKVFVGLSGGVDSSVSAALLKRAGYDVTGVFIKVWQPDFLPCTWRDDRRDAMRVAAKLEIPFLTFDFEKEYKQDVVDYIIREYKAGRTPNPDVMCNKYVKFGAFFNLAREMGADFVATGHYARVRRTQNVERKTSEIKEVLRSTLHVPKYELLAGVDENKDQSYFLWTLNQKILSHTFFPVGGYKKGKVRELAKKFGLPTFDKKDSQGLCFIGKLDMKEFLSHYIKPKSGHVLNEKNEVIGHHDGAWFLTPGERHGFTVTKKSPDDAPFYVFKKDVSKNTITVGPKAEKRAGLGERTSLSGVNWIGETPKTGREYGCRQRYHAPLSLCKIENVSEREAGLSVKKNSDVFAPGQSCVLYDGDVCLGGGIIGSRR